MKHELEDVVWQKILDRFDAYLQSGVGETGLESMLMMLTSVMNGENYPVFERFQAAERLSYFLLRRESFDSWFFEEALGSKESFFKALFDFQKKIEQAVKSPQDEWHSLVIKYAQEHQSAYHHTLANLNEIKLRLLAFDSDRLQPQDPIISLLLTDTESEKIHTHFAQALTHFKYLMRNQWHFTQLKDENKLDILQAQCTAFETDFIFDRLKRFQIEYITHVLQPDLLKAWDDVYLKRRKTGDAPIQKTLETILFIGEKLIQTQAFDAASAWEKVFWKETHKNPQFSKQLMDLSCQREEASQNAQPLLKRQDFACWRKRLTQYRDDLKHVLNAIDDLKIQSAALARFNQKIQTFVQDLWAHCINSVDTFIVNPPPVKYSLIALGSMSRHAMLPYSDFECALLLEKTEDEPWDWRDEASKNSHEATPGSYYLQHVFELFEIYVVSLGEEFPEKQGFSLDSAAHPRIARYPNAGSTGMGLTGTIEKLLNIDHEGQDEIGRFYSLMHPRFLAGDRTLFETYRHQLTLKTSSHCLEDKFPSLSWAQHWLIHVQFPQGNGENTQNLYQHELKNVVLLPGFRQNLKTPWVTLLTFFLLDLAFYWDIHPESFEISSIVHALVQSRLLSIDLGEKIKHYFHLLQIERAKQHLKAGRESHEVILEEPLIQQLTDLHHQILKPFYENLPILCKKGWPCFQQALWEAWTPFELGYPQSSQAQIQLLIPENPSPWINLSPQWVQKILKHGRIHYDPETGNSATFIEGDFCLKILEPQGHKADQEGALSTWTSREYAVLMLSQLLGIQHIPNGCAGRLKCIANGKVQTLTIWLAKRIDGDTLEAYAQKYPVPDSFDSIHFAQLFLLSLLIYPEDYHPNNFIVSTVRGAPTLIPIDNKRSFVQPHAIFKSFFKKITKPHVKNILFLLEKNMREPVPEVVSNVFLKIQENALSHDFETKLQAFDHLLYQLGITYPKAEPPFRAISLSKIFSCWPAFRIQQIQEVLSNPQPTNFDLLRSLEPLLFDHYESLILTKGLEDNAQTSICDFFYQQFPEHYRKVKINDLFKTSTNTTRLQIESYGKAQKSDLKTLLNSDLPITPWLEKTEVGTRSQPMQEILLYLIKQQAEPLTEIHLSGCEGVTDGWLEQTLKKTTQLKVLRIENCKNTTLRAWETLVNYIPELKELYAGHNPQWVDFLDPINFKKVFTGLEVLDMPGMELKERFFWSIQANLMTLRQVRFGIHDHSDDILSALKALKQKSLLTFENSHLLCHLKLSRLAINENNIQNYLGTIQNVGLIDFNDVIEKSALKDIKILQLSHINFGLRNPETVNILYANGLITFENLEKLLGVWTPKTASALKSIKEANLLNQTTFDFICHHLRNSYAITAYYDLLTTADLLTLENLEKLLEKETDRLVIKPALEALMKAQRLNQTTFDLVCQHADGLSVINFFYNLLINADLLTLENLENLLQKKEDRRDIERALKALMEAEMLNQTTFDLVCQYFGNADAVASCCNLLATADLLTLENLENLLQKEEDRRDIERALKALMEAEMLNQATFDLVCQYSGNADAVTSCCNLLAAADLLTPENLEKLLQKEEDRWGIKKALEALMEAEMLNQATFDLICQYFSSIAFCYILLARAGLLTSENLEKLLQKEEDRWGIKKALEALMKVQRLNQTTFDLICQYSSNADAVTSCCDLLARVDLLTPENLEKLLQKGEDGLRIGPALRALMHNYMLNQTTFDLICQHSSNAHNIDSCYIPLSRAGLLTLKNLKKLLEKKNCWEIKRAFETLIKAEMLNQTTFDFVCQHPSDDYTIDLFYIPLARVDLLTSENLKKLLQKKEEGRWGIKKALEVLIKAEMLNQTTFDFVCQHPRNSYAITAYYHLLTTIDLLTLENLEKLLTLDKRLEKKNCWEIKRAFETLIKANMLNQTTFDFVCQHPRNSYAITAYYHLLARIDLLTLENLEKLLEQKDHWKINLVLDTFIKAEMLNQATFDLACQYPAEQANLLKQHQLALKSPLDDNRYLSLKSRIQGFLKKYYFLTTGCETLLQQLEHYYAPSELAVQSSQSKANALFSFTSSYNPLFWSDISVSDSQDRIPIHKLNVKL